MTKKAKFEVFPDRAKGWRWRLVAANGKILATGGGDGYKRPGECIRAAYRAGRAGVEAAARGVEIIR